MLLIVDVGLRDSLGLELCKLLFVHLVLLAWVTVLNGALTRVSGDARSVSVALAARFGWEDADMVSRQRCWED